MCTSHSLLPFGSTSTSCYPAHRAQAHTWSTQVRESALDDYLLNRAEQAYDPSLGRDEGEAPGLNRLLEQIAKDTTEVSWAKGPRRRKAEENKRS